MTRPPRLRVRGLAGRGGDWRREGRGGGGGQLVLRSCGVNTDNPHHDGRRGQRSAQCRGVASHERPPEPWVPLAGRPAPHAGHVPWVAGGSRLLPPRCPPAATFPGGGCASPRHYARGPRGAAQPPNIPAASTASLRRRGPLVPPGTPPPAVLIFSPPWTGGWGSATLSEGSIGPLWHNGFRAWHDDFKTQLYTCQAHQKLHGPSLLSS